MDKQILLLLILAVIGSLFVFNPFTITLFANENEFITDIGIGTSLSTDILDWGKLSVYSPACTETQQEGRGNTVRGYLGYGYGDYCDLFDRQCNRYVGSFEDQYVTLTSTSDGYGCHSGPLRSREYVVFEFKRENMKIEFEQKYNFFQGEKTRYKITVTNTYPEVLPMWFNFRVWVINKNPAGVFGYDLTPKDIPPIPLGTSVYYVDLPTSQLGEHAIKAVVTAGQPQDWGGKTIAASDVAEQIYLVNPKPIYLTEAGDCTNSPIKPEGYVCQEESKLWLREDIIKNKLTCQKVGCPITPDKTYGCSSAGICTETVAIYKGCTSDAICPQDTKCDTNSGVCIKTEIFNDVVQCTTSSDCLTPCEGVTPSCVSNRCEYSGTCKLTTVQCTQTSECPAAPCSGVIPRCADNKCSYSGSCDPIYLRLDCSDPAVVCPNGYKCDTTFKPAVCVFKSAGGGDCNLLDADAATPEHPAGMFTQPCLGNAVCMCGTNKDIPCSSPNINGEDSSKVGMCVRTIQVNCEQIGCPEGYSCLAGVCKTEIIVTADCKVIGCPKDYTCSDLGVCLKETENVIIKYVEVIVEKKIYVPVKEVVKEVPLWIWIFIGGLIIWWKLKR